MKDFAAQIEEIKSTRIQSYKVLTIDLSTARSEAEYNIAGNYLIVIDATDINASVGICFNDSSSEDISFRKRQGVRTPFYRFFITNAAQAGKSVTIAVALTEMPFEVIDQSAVFEINSIAHLESSGVNLYNVTCTNAATEYSQALPANTKRFTVKARGGALQVSFTGGQSGATYIYLTDGQSMSFDMLYLAAQTVYFQSAAAGTIAEVIAWS